jgi:hypothetical protein
MKSFLGCWLLKLGLRGLIRIGLKRLKRGKSSTCDGKADFAECGRDFDCGSGWIGRRRSLPKTGRIGTVKCFRLITFPSCEPGRGVAAGALSSPVHTGSARVFSGMNGNSLWRRVSIQPRALPLSQAAEIIRAEDRRLGKIVLRSVLALRPTRQLFCRLPGTYNRDEKAGLMLNSNFPVPGTRESRGVVRLLAHCPG